MMIIGRAIDALRTGMTVVLLAPVHLWRATAVMRQPRCRYYPSCSTYAVGALRIHGPVRGSVLAAGRLLRCHPWSSGGIDHVPPGRARSGSVGITSPSSPSCPSQVQSSATSFGVRDA